MFIEVYIIVLLAQYHGNRRGIFCFKECYLMPLNKNIPFFKTSFWSGKNKASPISYDKLVLLLFGLFAFCINPILPHQMYIKGRIAESMRLRKRFTGSF
jgi:hypothetical protein